MTRVLAVAAKNTSIAVGDDMSAWGLDKSSRGWYTVVDYYYL